MVVFICEVVVVGEMELEVEDTITYAMLTLHLRWSLTCGLPFLISSRLQILRTLNECTHKHSQEYIVKHTHTHTRKYRTDKENLITMERIQV